VVISDNAVGTVKVGTIINVISHYNVGYNKEMTGGSPFSMPSGAQALIIEELVDPADGILMYRVEYTSRTGWVSSRYMSVETVTSADGAGSSSSSPDAGNSPGNTGGNTGGGSTQQMGTIVNVANAYHVGNNPQLTGSSPFAIPAGGRVTINYTEVDPNDGMLMYNVTYMGQSGWVSPNYLALD
jgi:hypothetical protein